MLRLPEIPSRLGQTLFSDMAQAYDSLPGEVKKGSLLAPHRWLTGGGYPDRPVVDINVDSAWAGVVRALSIGA